MKIRTPLSKIENVNLINTMKIQFFCQITGWKLGTTERDFNKLF